MTAEQKLVNKTIISLRQGDITRQEVDAIVNAANSSLLGGGGVDGAIHRTGGPSILEECKQIRNSHGTCRPGNAVITGGGNLPAQYVIHTVGPVWRGGGSDEEAVLASAYRTSLELAVQHEVRTVAFPSISTGAYGFPVDRASTIAVETACAFSESCEALKEIRFVLFDQSTYKCFKSRLEE